MLAKVIVICLFAGGIGFVIYGLVSLMLSTVRHRKRMNELCEYIERNSGENDES